jgi:hypothetical protein
LIKAAEERKAVRPFVMQMLRDPGWSAASGGLAILAAWKDRDALPEIWKLAAAERSNARGDAVAAYLAIESGEQAERDLLGLLEVHGRFSNEAVLWGMARAEIPIERRVAMLKAGEAKIGVAARNAMTLALREERAKGRDIGPPLKGLMDGETSLSDLTAYCQLAVEDKEKRFGPQVLRAVKLAAADAAVIGENCEEANAVKGILEAAACYDLKDAAKEVRTLAGSANGEIRAAAYATGARIGVEGMIEKLYGELGSEEVSERRSAARGLMGFNPVDEKSRQAREDAVLARVGTSAEDYALRVLVTCGREKSVKVLRGMLDDPDAQRAVYAAWVLAQLPDKAAAEKGLQYVAIFGMFRGYVG